MKRGLNKVKVFYVGRFPGPYGGVTLKNKMLYENLLKHVKIEKVELGLIRKMNIKEIIKLCIALINPSSTLLIGAASTSRKILTGFLYKFNRKALNKSILFVMGGIASRIIAEDPKYSKWVSGYKCVYVQTKGMKRELDEVGMTNVRILPTCRENPGVLPEVKQQNDKELRCVFFSLISKEKGADIVLEAADLLRKKNIDFSIDFYGHIDENYTSEFKANINKNNNVNYCGIFRPDQESVYEKLQEYDVLLFPTRWKAEGVPAILVESKIASLPVIASDTNYNSEIIAHGKDGLILKQNNSFQLVNEIERVNLDRSWLKQMKYNAKLSSDRYLIENYILDIVDMLKN